MTGTKRDNYFAIIMAGGVGSRFWPMSKVNCPKQFQDILGNGETLFQTTFKRLKKIIPVENIYVLTNIDYVDMIKEQIPTIKTEQIVPEPAMRNTAPSILLGSLKIHKKNPDSITIVAPSDHHIKDEEEFTLAVQKAFDTVEKDDKLITLGIEPDHPNTGYGYINFEDGSKDLKRVKQFTEKPSLKNAEKFLKQGHYLWNAGIFIWSTNYILQCFQQYLPEMNELLSKGKDLYNENGEQDFLNENYPNAENISIDFGIMEKAQEVFVIPVDFGWSDLGTWTALDKQLPRDNSGNLLVNCRVYAEDSKNNIISSKNKKIIVLQGLSEHIVVEDDDVIMVVPKSEEQNIKNLRNKVMDEYGKDLG